MLTTHFSLVLRLKMSGAIPLLALRVFIVSTGTGFETVKEYSWILCLWFRASLIYINNYPTRCNTKQSVYYSASSICMFRVSATPIMSTQNCNYSLRYLSYFLCSYLPTLATLEGGSCTKIWPVPEVVVTVLCTPDGGCGWHPKHVNLQNNK